jgi:hypothetical protein
MKFIGLPILFISVLLSCNDKPESIAPANSLLNVYPNPAKGSIQLSVWNSSSRDYDLTVIDTNGEAIFEERVPPAGNPQQFNVKVGDKQGYLFVTLVTDKETIMRKVLNL